MNTKFLKQIVKIYSFFFIFTSGLSAIMLFLSILVTIFGNPHRQGTTPLSILFVSTIILVISYPLAYILDEVEHKHIK